MLASRFFSFVLVIMAGAALAQKAPPATVSATALDCIAQDMHHDHGAERGIPPPKRVGCSVAPPTAPAAKAKLGHDHAKFHKLM